MMDPVTKAWGNEPKKIALFCNPKGQEITTGNTEQEKLPKCDQGVAPWTWARVCGFLSCTWFAKKALNTKS